MPSTTEVSASQKSAYQRPYKTRGQRRETARRKFDENADRRFLTRALLMVGVLLLIAAGVALKDSMEANTNSLPTMQALR